MPQGSSYGYRPSQDIGTLLSSERTSVVPLGAAYLRKRSWKTPRMRLDVGAGRTESSQVKTPCGVGAVVGEGLRKDPV